MINDPEDEAFNEIERQAKQRKEAVQSALKTALNTDYRMLERSVVAYEAELRNATIEEIAQHIEKLKGFGQDTVSSLAIYIRGMKK